MSCSVKSAIALDVGIARIEQNRLRGERGDALDRIGRAVRARPDRQQAGHAAGNDVDRAGQQRIVHGGGAVEGGPHHLDLGNAERLGMLLEQLVLLHHIELQVAHGELPRKADLGHLRVAAVARTDTARLRRNARSPICLCKAHSRFLRWILFRPRGGQRA